MSTWEVLEAMSKWLWIAPLMVGAAGWGQTNAPLPTVIPETPLGGHVIPSGTEFHLRINEALSTGRNQAATHSRLRSWLPSW